jgi:hypothetical protein
MQCCFEVPELSITNPTSDINIDLNYDNNDQGFIIASRDAQFPGAQPQFVFTGGNNSYVSAGAVVIE